MTATYYIGDSLTVLRTLPDNSVDLVLTSPPFLALRSYLPADHPDKAKEMGSEATPGEFLDALLDIVEECARVLAPHGSLCVELGDTYSGSGGAGGDYSDDGLRAGQPEFSQNKSKRGGTRWGPRLDTGGTGWPLAKSLCCIPQLFEIALAYGFNPLTGRKTDPWRVRNMIAWCRPNPPVGALGDKFRPGTSYMTVACKSAKRYFDLDAVREPYSPNTNARTAKGIDSLERSGKSADRDGNWSTMPEQNNNGAGAPPLDWWLIPTEPYKGSHYATFPSDLCIRPVKAMCPEKVCRTCGVPSVRITKTDHELADGDNRAFIGSPAKGSAFQPLIKSVVETLGFTDCGHDDYRPGVVLDPFAGSGTTLAVATGHGRDAIGIDLDERNADLASERVGMFLEVIDTRENVA